MDHVKQYKIPREFYEEEQKKPKIEDEESIGDVEEEDDEEFAGLDKYEIQQMKRQKKMYKPTGPDGKGWGDFRQINEPDLQLLEELQEI